MNDVHSAIIDDMITKNARAPSSMAIQEETIFPSFDMMDAETFQNLLFALLSCGVCGDILADPVTLQCGNTLCRACLPGSIDVGNQCDVITEGGNFDTRALAGFNKQCARGRSDLFSVNGNVYVRHIFNFAIVIE